MDLAEVTIHHELRHDFAYLTFLLECNNPFLSSLPSQLGWGTCVFCTDFLLRSLRLWNSFLLCFLSYFWVYHSRRRGFLGFDGIFIGSDSWTDSKSYVSSKGYEVGQGSWTCESPKYYTTWEAKQKATKDAAHAARPGLL